VRSETWRALGPFLGGLGLATLLAIGGLLAWSRWQASAVFNMPNVPLAVDKSLGINTDLSPLDMVERHEALAAMQDAGFRWLRQRFSWHAIEPEQGTYDWTVWDEIVEDVGQYRIQLIAVLDGSPPWARAGEDVGNPLAPPVETRFFGDFAAAFAARYGDRIDHYQVWDEPNIAPHWGTREIDPAAYGRLLQEGAIRIRAADPEAVILAAALAPNVETGGANISELHFLDALYQQNAQEWFDVVSAQPYSLEEPVDSPPDGGRLNWQRISLLREVMEAHGDAQTAIWAVSSGLTDASAEGVGQALEQARLEWPWLGPVLWAAWNPGDRQGQYALVGADGRPGQMYEALRGLASAPVQAWPGVYPADHPSGHYEGNWRVTPFGADIGNSGDRLAIPFRGTRLDLTMRRGDYRAFLFVTVDGKATNDLPRDTAGRAYLVLYDPLRQVATVTLARGLPDGLHLAELVAERGWGQWAIVGWSVFREAPTGIPWLFICLSLGAIVVMTVTVGRSWPHRVLALKSVSTHVDRYRLLDKRVLLVLTAGVAVLLYVTAGTIPTLATLTILAVLLVLCPEMGLCLIAFTLPFYQLGRPMLGKVFSMVEILTLLTAGGWLVNAVLAEPRSLFDVSRLRQQAARLTAVDWGVLALIVAGALSITWAEHSRVAAREFRTVILEAGVFYSLLRAMVPGRHREGRKWAGVWRVADAWVLGGALIALVGLFQWFLGYNLITAEGVWRVRGFYGSPNNLALYLGKVFPLTVALVAWGRKGRRRWFYGLAAMLIAMAIFLTYSRGAWLVGVPVSLLFLAAMRGRRTLVVAIGGLVLAGVVLLLLVGTGRLTSLLDTAEGTTFFRLQLWESSWAMIRDHPVLGVGLDNFLYHYRSQYVLPTAWEEFNLSHPHNLVFDFWLRLGVPGLVVLIWLLVSFFRRGIRTYCLLPSGDERLLALGLMAGMVNLLAHGLVDNAFFLVDLAFTFMLMLALVQAIGDESQMARPEQPLIGRA
jgi:putative inorganic carbon (HCO3(-)) transporter